MKIISYGKKKGQLTAEVVLISDGKSFTKHLNHLYGKTFVDWDQNEYTLTKKD